MNEKDNSFFKEYLMKEVGYYKSFIGDVKIGEEPCTPVPRTRENILSACDIIFSPITIARTFNTSKAETLEDMVDLVEKIAKGI